MKCIFLILFICVNTYSQMPHEVAFLVNSQSEDSKKIANYFVNIRKIPKNNVIYLNVPESIFGGKSICSPENFSKYIWNPANEIIHERDLDNQLLAWVYSSDFPIRIEISPNPRAQVSLCGQTFLKNQNIGLSIIEDGKYLSKLFAGPNERLPYYLPSFSLRKYKEKLGSIIPLPSMMLGYTGYKGNTSDEIVNLIKKGYTSDYKGRAEGIWFVTNSNIRSTCRAWQYPDVKKRLSNRGIAVTITNQLPIGKNNIMGVFCGSKVVDTSDIKSFYPGAVAEHLTSWAAEFQKPQTKCTSWISAGATATCGSVVEPYSNPNKFPSARFFDHYVSGCSILESFYQSTASPLQQLFLGDPFAKPYAPRIKVDILGSNRIKNFFNYVAKSECIIPNAKLKYIFLIDGKIVQHSSENYVLKVNTELLSDGFHEIYVIAHLENNTESYGVAKKDFIVNRLGRSINIHPEINEIRTSIYELKPEILCEDKPEKVRLVSGNLILDEKEYIKDLKFYLDERDLGEGPSSIQIESIYSDNMIVSSFPLQIYIKYNNK